MFANYVKIALRNLRRQKGYAFINIAGLAIGVAACLLIVLYVRHELSYDRFHKKAERIYRVASQRSTGQAVERIAKAPFPAARTLANNLPEIEQSVRLFRATNGASVSLAEDRYTEMQFYFADPGFFELFDFPLIRGERSAVLAQPDAMVITKKIAQKYFGDQNPVGKRLNVRLVGREEDFVITGVVEKTGRPSHIDFDFLISFESSLNLWDVMHGGEWDAGILGAWTYLLLGDGASADDLERKLPELVRSHAQASVQNRISFFLQPLTDVHLNSQLRGEIGTNGNILYIYLFSIIAFLVLLIACINFMNLATARSMRRAKEVGMRKTLGAQKQQLVRQFLGESLVVSFIAVVLAVLIVYLTLPWFSALIGQSLQFDAGDGFLILSLLGFCLLTGVLAGGYPAFFLSKFKPVNALKSALSVSRDGHSTLRKILVAAQFSVAVALLSSLAIISNQLDFLRHKELGFNKEELLVITGRVGVNYETFKNALQQDSRILGVTAAARIPGGRPLPSNLFYRQGQNKEAGLTMDWLHVDQDFLQTFELELLQGANFTEEDPDGAILNETAAQLLAFAKSPLGRTIIQVDDLKRIRERRVIGIVKDVHFESLHTQVKPLVMTGEGRGRSRIVVRIAAGDVSGALDHIRAAWQTIPQSREWPLDFFFVDQELENLYQQEERLSNMVQSFSGLAMLVSCLGLFGLAAYSAEQRTKEIGIRKVFGASIGRVMVLLSKEFIWLIGAAFVIAAPISFVLMQSWLQGFAYRAEITLGAFLWAGGLAALIAGLTISFQTIKAAVANPIESLRHE